MDGNLSPPWIKNDNIESLHDLLNITLTSGNYLYYTSQENWIENGETLREGDWMSPVLLRGTDSNGNDYSESQINTINTFNNLTGGGQTQGIFLDKETKKTYINAEFIQTGTLSALTADMGTLTAGKIQSEDFDKVDIITKKYYYVTKVASTNNTLAGNTTYKNIDSSSLFTFDFSTIVDQKINSNILKIDTSITSNYYFLLEDWIGKVYLELTTKDYTTETGHLNKTLYLRISSSVDENDKIIISGQLMKDASNTETSDFTVDDLTDYFGNGTDDIESISLKINSQTNFPLIDFFGVVEDLDKNINLPSSGGEISFSEVYQKDGKNILYPKITFPNLIISGKGDGNEDSLLIGKGRFFLTNEKQANIEERIYFGDNETGFNIETINTQNTRFEKICLLTNGIKYTIMDANIFEDQLILDFTNKTLIGKWSFETSSGEKTTLQKLEERITALENK